MLKFRKWLSTAEAKNVNVETQFIKRFNISTIVSVMY